MRLWLHLFSLVAAGLCVHAFSYNGGNSQSGNPSAIKRPPRPPQNQQSQSSGESRLREVFSWTQLDFVYPNQRAREQAINSGSFVPDGSMVPISVFGAGNRVFLAMPRWKQGVPATLAYVELSSTNRSPPLIPYPSWELNRQGNCQGLTSVFRVMVDDCDRLWVLDTGLVNSFEDGKRICPPQVVTIDLKTDRIINRFRIPQSALKEDSLPVTIEVEYPKGNCGKLTDAVVYMADTTTYAIIVADLSTNRAWRVTDKTVFPSPEAGTFNVAGETFELMDGVLALALGPNLDQRGRTLYFSAMSSFQQRWVHTSVLRNESAANSQPLAFQTGTQMRPGQSAGSGMDKNGVLFFGFVNSDTLACWNTRKSFEPRNIAKLAQNSQTMQFFATVSVDKRQRVWAISSRFQSFFSGTMNPRDVNFRVFMAESSTELIKDTVCANDASNFNAPQQLVFRP
ncbi:protein yellow-like [Cloeon dipterum]|uniref:protein yellow-like n=1 Tax=Cloeon dipterum TaxID=197152 RepID=UPI00321FDFEE